MGGAGGGAHLPSNMAGGAHLPSNMGGGAGAHVPSGMSHPTAAHVPGGMSGAGHTAYGSHAAPAVHTAAAGGIRHDSVGRPEAARVGAAGEHGGGIHGGEARAGIAGEHGGGVHGGEARALVPEHRPGTPGTVMRGAHGALIVAGGAAGVHAAMARPYLHPDLHANMPREHAEVEHDREFVHMHEHDFHTNRVRDFNRHEMEAWRHGLWRDEWHYGRRGWWWETDGVWYPYGDPVWPYPLVVAPLTVYDTTEVEGPPPPYAQDVPPVPGVAYASGGPPPPGAGPAGAAAAGIAPLPAPPPGWYRCGDPSGYYPTVGACNGPWTLVQEAPPGSGQ
jgi:hypothetical protein